MDLPIDKSLKKVKWMLRVTGLSHESMVRTRVEKMIYLFNFSWIMTDIIGCVGWIFEGILTGRRIIELTHVTPCLNIGMMAEFKTYFFVTNSTKAKELLNNLRKLEMRRLDKHSDTEKLVDLETKFLYLVLRVLVAVNGILIFLFLMSPLIMTTVKYFLQQELEFFLPFLDVYPGDCVSWPLWPFAYIHQAWTTCVVLTSIFTADYIFFLCCTHIRIQFRLLQRELEKMVPPTDGLFKATGEFRKKFKDWILWHQAVIGSANSLETLYSKSTLFNCLTSSLVICLTGFNVTAVSDIAIVISFAAILIMGLFQIFFLCFFGDMLSISSTGVSGAAYNCRWYQADANISKDILTIQIRAQKPCKLTAAGFADVNLKAFMKILSTSWSYFALLQTMYSHTQQIN